LARVARREKRGVQRTSMKRGRFEGKVAFVTGACDVTSSEQVQAAL
jgi:hypothetical protein